MSFRFTLQKVLDVKEHEKNEAQAAYKQALENFEQTAMKLYQLLKRKEDLLEAYEKAIQDGVSIAKIQHTQETLSFLQKKIDRMQIETQRARALMNEKQRLLKNSYIDVKKYEKMKERKLENYMLEQREIENKFLDEVSVQQYIKR